MKKTKLFIFFILIGNFVFAQNANMLFGIRNEANSFDFVKVNCNNDSLTVLNNTSIHYYGSSYSSSFDFINNKYFFCTSQTLEIFDVQSGNLDTTYNFASINPIHFEHIVFNSFDNYIYGIKEDWATSLLTMAKFNPSTGIFIDLFTLPQTIQIGIGCKATIDPYLNEYFIQSQNLAGINLQTGQVLYNLPLQNSTNEWLDHFAYSCNQKRFFGLTNNYHTVENYFSEIDSSTGVTSKVNASPLATYFYKQYLSGCTIDNSTNIFYYGVLSKIYGIDITTGTVVYSHDFGSDYQFLFLESGSSFDCLTADVHELNKENISVFPNPSNGIFTFIFKNSNSKKLILEIYNLSGQLLKTEVVTREKTFELDLSVSENGIYFYKLKGEDSVVMGKLVKVE